ncbi:MAG: nucleotidyltransferase domain-containing protein [Acidobacteria bacterium]|nr:nucleotidyltransferase domain-containing protein [Acidobacteriota bacterium]
MDKKLEALVENLNKAHADNLVSVVLYGSAVTGEHKEGRSDYNVLVVLNHITPSELRAAHPVAEQWQKDGNPLPLYFTREEMLRAPDVFPIEFIDMSRAHQVWYGSDPFEGLQIPRYNLRHQLEYELRGKLIRLRHLYIPASREAKRLSALMVDSLNSFAVLIRHVLGLMGEEPPLTKREAIVRLGKRAKLEVTPLLKVLELGEQEKELTLDQATAYFTEYLAVMEAMIHRVDELEEA